MNSIPKCTTCDVDLIPNGGLINSNEILWTCPVCRCDYFNEEADQYENDVRQQKNKWINFSSNQESKDMRTWHGEKKEL